MVAREATLEEILAKTAPWKRVLCIVVGHVFQKTCLINESESCEARICLRCGYAYEFLTKDRIYFPKEDMPESHKQELRDWYYNHPESYPESIQTALKDNS